MKWVTVGAIALILIGIVYQQAWIHEIQPKLLRLSTQGKQIVVMNSGHGIPQEAPKAVVDAIQEVVAQARATTN